MESDSPQLRPQVNGHDLLSDYRNDRGLDPERLLPPLSAVLLPTRAGQIALIGACSCGVAACGSLSMRVRRIGSEVVWEPVEDAEDETLARQYRFTLVDYLNALDNAAEDRPAEGQGRRVARLVQQMLRRYDQRNDTSAVFERAWIDWIGAWPWTSSTVQASVNVVGDDDQRLLEFGPGPRETDRHFAARVAAELLRIRHSEAHD
jgi:hypothetical protein